MEDIFRKCCAWMTVYVDSTEQGSGEMGLLLKKKREGWIWDFWPRSIALQQDSFLAWRSGGVDGLIKRGYPKWRSLSGNVTPFMTITHRM